MRSDTMEASQPRFSMALRALANRNLAGSIVVALAVIGLAWLQQSATEELLDTSRRVEHTREVESELQMTISALREAETGQRGFLIDGDASYLEPYDRAIGNVDGHLKRLGTLLADEPAQRRSLRDLRRLVATKLEEMAATLRLFNSGDRAAALQVFRSGAGLRIMDQVQDLADAMRTQEGSLLAARADRAARAARRLKVTSIFGGAIVLMLLAVLLVVTRSDLLGRARAEAEALESEARLRTTIRSIADGVLVTDLRGRITFLNAVAERLTGWREEEAIGRSVGEIFRTRDGPRVPGGDSPVAAAGGQAVAPALASSETLVSRNGTETAIAPSAAMIRDERGREHGVVLVFRDITERRRSELAVLRLAAIVASSAKAIIGETLDNVVTDWNPGAEGLFGFTAAEMIGRRLRDAAPPIGDDPEPRIMQELLAGRRVADFDTRRKTRDGRTIDVAESVSAIRDAQGTVVGFSRIVRDVTASRRQREELEEARKRLEEANAAKDRFLAMLSHELRTPLTPILASVHRLERRGPLPAGLAASLAMIRRNAELEVRLINDLLDLTRIARGKIQLEIAPVDLHAVLTSVVQTCRSEAVGKGLQIDVRLAAAEHFVMGDAARLQQIFWNLVRNGIKFTPSGGKIVVTSENPGAGAVIVTVRDTGSGIRPEFLPRVFEAFEQDGATVPRAGLGLGLSIAKTLVEEHGGRIGAESPGEGRGSCFSVRLATTGARPAVPIPLAVPETALDARRRVAVLVVEDDPDTRDALQQLLQESGFDVRVAAGIEDAVRAHAKRPADVLVSDLGLADGNGWDLPERLAVGRGGPRAIALSGYGMERDVARSRSRGFDEHFVKPVNFDRLVAAIERLGIPPA
jgi:two-component system CheB/CheR fusion protein